MRILFVWPGLTGYMGDCWRELARRKDVDLKLVVDVSSAYYGGGFSAADVMRDLPWNDNLPSIIQNVDKRSWVPEVVFVVGWRNPLCREAATYFSRLKLSSVRFRKLVLVCCFDMPWEWRIRKIMARFVLWRYLRKFDAAFVNGVSAKKYARWLGFKKDRVYTGLIGTNINRFTKHVGGAGFLYLGRDVPEKGLDVLRKANAIYRAKGGTWDLKIISGVSPCKVAMYYERADCFVLPSLWEPWGVVLVEAAATGLPIICTDKCGARFEVVRDNGVVVRSDSAEELAIAMLTIESMKDVERARFGEKGKSLARPYSCEAWANRVLSLSKELVNV